MKIISRRNFLAISGFSLLSLSGCSSNNEIPSEQQPSEQQEKEPPSIEVLENGYQQTPDGYVTWWAVAKNNSDSFAVEMPQIKFTAYGSDGSVLGTDTQPLTLHTNLTAVPGQTFGVNGIIGPINAEIASVETQAEEPEEYFEIDGDIPSFEISNTSESPDGFGGVNISGEVTNGFERSADIQLVAVLRDESGKGVASGSSWSDGVNAGESGAFTHSSIHRPRTQLF